MSFARPASAGARAVLCRRMSARGSVGERLVALQATAQERQRPATTDRLLVVPGSPVLIWANRWPLRADCRQPPPGTELQRSMRLLAGQACGSAISIELPAPGSTPGRMLGKHAADSRPPPSGCFADRCKYERQSGSARAAWSAPVEPSGHVRSARWPCSRRAPVRLDAHGSSISPRAAWRSFEAPPLRAVAVMIVAQTRAIVAPACAVRCTPPTEPGARWSGCYGGNQVFAPADAYAGAPEAFCRGLSNLSIARFTASGMSFVGAPGGRDVYMIHLRHQRQPQRCGFSTPLRHQPVPGPWRARAVYARTGVRGN